jgi:multidrug efflux pump subunit AcrB
MPPHNDSNVEPDRVTWIEHQPAHDAPPLGVAGRLARGWINSKLTPLFIAASLLLGAFSVFMLPREEEPQIVVPMIDVFVGMPGASAREVEERVTKPMEKLLWEIPGVEYIYSTSRPGGALAIVRFRVGEDEENSIVKLNQKMFANFDLIPPGASQPLIKPRSIDDVPILALTFTSARYDDAQLRRVAAQVHDTVKQVENVSAVTLIGGQRRELRVVLDETRLAAYNVAPLQVMGALGSANRRTETGAYASGNREFLLETGEFLTCAEDVRNVVIGASGGRAVYVRDVAAVIDGGNEPSQYVQWASKVGHTGFQSAVTVAVSKRKGANAIDVADAVLRRVDGLKGAVIPADVQVEITRHYGHTAAEKSNELLFHMAIAVISVSLLIALTLGFRESLIVFAAIPVTLALTLTVFYLYGYTLNRITLFALIFSIGILVDDAIVVVENIVRHWRMPENAGRPLSEIAVKAVDEVGNPTILATLAVIAAILPMAFVRGLMGPYMRPIPIGASAAMVFSLIVAFLVTPWAAIRLLKKGGTHGHAHKEDRLTLLYRRFMGGLLAHTPMRWSFLAVVSVLLLGSMALVGIGFVKVKMLPFDNKSEFQVIIDMPDGTPLEQTARVTRALADEVLNVPEVTDVQTYTGTAAPFNFNGLVRHYYLRNGSNIGDIQVNLLPKHGRDRQSHEVAKAARVRLQPIADRFGARMKVAEVPPGPPVLQTLVAEIYGPTQDGQLAIARDVRALWKRTPGVVDVDWYVEDERPKRSLVVDKEKAALHGITQEDVAKTLRLATAGGSAGLLHVPGEKEDVPVVLRLSRASRSNLDTIQGLKIPSGDGRLVPLRELVTVAETTEDRSIYHKNLMPVTYVTADVAGVMESPVYAILKLGPEIAKIRIPDGYAIDQYTATQPEDASRYAMKWDGEWHITYEVFRDLGIAFAAVLVLIYILVVGWFQSFITPLVIMAAIPFSLVGILPAHGMLNAFFTATSMIGFIAGAGIVVRNSIILVDFIELRLSEGRPLAEAVVDAGAVRFRPMMLTAAAVVVGSLVILFDPIFQGLAIALMAGEIASLLLSRMTVPVVYFMVARRGRKGVVTNDSGSDVARHSGDLRSGVAGAGALL